MSTSFSIIHPPPNNNPQEFRRPEVVAASGAVRRPWLPLLLGFVVAPLVVACQGSRGSDEATADARGLTECDAYVAAYEQCLTSLGPTDVAHARAEQARAAISAQLMSDTASRTALRARCASNLDRLKVSCL